MNRTVVELPFSGRFFVHDINYGITSNQIELQDPDDCLPRRISNQLNLSGTPFFANQYETFSFFSCPSDTFFSSSYSWKNISCLGNSTHKVFVTASTSSVGINANCTLIATMPVPVEYISIMYRYLWFPYETIRLTWNLKAPYCKRNCNEKSNFPPYYCRDIRNVDRIIHLVVGIIIPTVLVIAVLCYHVLRNKGFFSDGGRGHAEIANSSQVVTINTSLDVSAVQSFPTVVISESGRLPNQDINLCSICLSEYQPKEVVKIMPICNHYFHADCIDSWFRLNLTCPVCRTSPFP
ncbi:putative RING-H2 finger protein ATL21A [Papaver somniferum]|uniref:putative RING-H2 finger protein ATL21A n=1 Tax=Papaver somniferum TaxID=3469 RepID=UPI000E6FBE76|nr:putative RING-H2 finger protein ATL21A [Papaver somniferum]